jgi:hypothetical protein
MTGNVLYSLSFLGTALANAPDLDLSADVTDTLPETVKAKGDALLLSFAEHAALPAAAEVYVAAGTHFSDAGGIDVYQIDPVSGEAVRIAMDGSVTDGYIVFDIESTNDIILAAGGLAGAADEGGGFPIVPLVIGVCAVVVIVIVIAIFIRRKKAASGAGDD